MNKLFGSWIYVVALGSLSLITWQTLLSFSTESKSVTICINRYGEQYADMLALVVIWVLCLIAVIYFVIKEK